MTKQSLPDTIEIDGVKYQKVKEPKKPQTLYDICVDWYYDGGKARRAHSVEDLVEYIARNWLPVPIIMDSDEDNPWNDGYNAYRQTLINNLGI